MPDTSLIGTTLAGNFRITGVIGEGGMATVYRGVPVAGGAEVAVKIMNPDLAKESRFVRRFRREARAAAMLKHPNTVQILEFGVDRGMVFLAMELLQGFDLAMLLHRERRIPEARAVQIVVQVCRALSAAHEQSIVHRDLKPDNIMLVPTPSGTAPPIAGMGPNDFVKVLDFGIAKILDEDPSADRSVDTRAEPITQEKSMLTRVGTIVGTPAYMAPEQGRAEAVDARTDLYACGVLLYELITGRVPFSGETPMQVVMRHVNEPPRPPSDLSKVDPGLEQLIMRALAKYPSQRQQSAEEMAFDLLRLLPTLTGAAVPLPEDDAAKKTLVLDQAAPAPNPLAGVTRAPQPRPAAGAPAPRPAAGAPATRANPPLPAPPPEPAKEEVNIGSPFPTLNIEVPDDIFPAALGAASLGAPATALPSSSNPAPTQRIDPATRAAPGGSPRPAAGAPAARPAPKPIPLVTPGAARPGLDQTMQSPGPGDSVPPPPSEDEEEAPTFVKAPPMAPTDAVKARMSLAEEQMAQALGQPPPGQPPAAQGAGIGQGLPKFSGPESVEPTLIAGQQPLDATRISNPPPGPVAASATAVPATHNLKDLQATVPLEPEEVERAMKEALAKRATPPPVAQAGLDKTAIVPEGPPPRVPEAAPLAADKPLRRPTSELIPIHAAEEPAAGAMAPQKVEAPLVWEPKGKRLSGATALVVGIAIGAVLVAIVIGVLFLLKGDAGN
ncbi:MAG: protein kinase [Polyangiaceae bacterium]|nr:protein kinase [Polyangiaceae bacterium]